MACRVTASAWLGIEASCLRDLACGVCQCGIVNTLPDQAHALGVFSRELVAEHRQPQGTRAAHEPRQHPGAT